MSQAEDFKGLLAELIEIGKGPGFLSMEPGDGFNSDLRNIRAREIGEEIDDMGGKDLMQQACEAVGFAIGPVAARELEAAWVGVRGWY